MTTNIRTFNDPALSAVCEPIQPGDDLSFLAEMRRTCEVLNGVGLAAPQIGVLKRAVFIWPQQKGGERLFMLNPVITHYGAFKCTEDEGCLSYPKFYTPVERSLLVRVEFVDEQFQPQRREFSFHPARVVQHEVDHLSGVCKVGDAWRLSRSMPQLVSTECGAR